MVISTTRIAPVGSVLPSSASATSLVRLSAMMPEPTTVATSNRGAERFRCQPARQIKVLHARLPLPSDRGGQTPYFYNTRNTVDSNPAL